MMWVIALLLFPCFAMVVVHAAQPRTWSLYLAAGSLALIFLAGAAGTLLGRHTVEAAVAHVGPDEVEHLREAGYREASRPIIFAAIACALGAIPFALGEIKRQR